MVQNTVGSLYASATRLMQSHGADAPAAYWILVKEDFLEHPSLYESPHLHHLIEKIQSDPETLQKIVDIALLGEDALGGINDEISSAFDCYLKEVKEKEERFKLYQSLKKEFDGQ